MHAQIFAYKGVIGATTDLQNGIFLNNPMGKQQLGCVIPSIEVDITKEAKELIKNAEREGGSFASIMLTRHSDGSGSSVALFGFHLHMFHGEDLCIGRDCDISVLDDCNTIDIEIPEGFKVAVDKLV